MRVKVLACEGVVRCVACGRDRADCTTTREFISPTCGPCADQREMAIAISDDLYDRLRIAMTGWLDFWTAFMPVEEVAGSDFEMAEQIIADMADELLPGSAA